MLACLRRFGSRATLIAACLLPSLAAATDYTDIWFNPAESGWGVNVVQSDSFMFVTFFIYGADNKPTWYTGSLTGNGTVYAGNLYATHGTFWVSPWNPADHPDAQLVGTASFQPSAANAYQATLVYAINGTGSVSKAITRQTLTPIAIGGNYVGGQGGAYSGCSASGAYTDEYSLAVSQSSSGTATLIFTYASGATCTISGTLQQNGQLYQMLGASYACTGNLSFSTTAAMTEMKATSLGFEGRLSASLPSGCKENAFFSGVLL